MKQERSHPLFQGHYKRRKCRWKLSDNPDDTIYESSCGQSWLLIDGTPEENDYNYCPYCGHEIENPDTNAGEGN